MPADTTKHFMGDVYVGDVGFGFLVLDSRGCDTETTIDDSTAHAIVEAAGGDRTAAFKPANLFEISAEEFESYRDTEIIVADLPDGVSIWQVKG